MLHEVRAVLSGRSWAGRSVSLSFVMAALLLCAPLPLFAQDRGAEAPDPELLARLQAAYASEENSICLISASGEEGVPQTILAGCDGQGLLLGAADTFETATNEAGDVQVVLLRTGSDLKVLMLTLDGEGRPVIENLTASLARSAGRGAMANLRDIDVNITGFARTGRIDLVPVAREGARSSRESSFDTGRLRAAELSRGRGRPVDVRSVDGQGRGEN